MNLSFDVPVPHLPDFLDLMDFRVAHAKVAFADPKYREKIKPLDLLLAEPQQPDELRRVLSLTTPLHVTVHPPLHEEMATRFLEACNVAFDTELAVVVPPESIMIFDLAIREDVSVIYIPEATRRSLTLYTRLQQHRGPWIHFEEIADAEELRDMLRLELLNGSSLHTAKPVKMAFYDCDWAGAAELPALDPYQALTREQVAKARELMTAMRDVTR